MGQPAIRKIRLTEEEKEERRKARRELVRQHDPRLNKKLYVTPMLLQDVERMARLGMYNKDIATALNITPQYLAVAQRSYPELADAIAKGRLAGVEKALTNITDSLDSSDERIRIDVSKYYLKTFGDYKEVQSIEHTMKPPSEFIDVPSEVILDALEDPDEQE